MSFRSSGVTSRVIFSVISSKDTANVGVGGSVIIGASEEPRVPMARKPWNSSGMSAGVSWASKEIS